MGGRQLREFSSQELTALKQFIIISILEMGKKEVKGKPITSKINTNKLNKFDLKEPVWPSD